MAQIKRQKAILRFLKTTFAVLLFSFSFSANALTISPPRIELEGDSGTVLNGVVKIYNEREEEETFYTSYENFEAKGESGTPSFTSSTEDLAGWISTIDTITLKPGEEKKIPYTINIPKNAEPGGHFAAIFWSTTPPQNSQISVGAKIGMLVLLRVSGEITEKGGIVEFSTKNGQKFFTSLPVDFYYRFKNDGNDRAKPVGLVKMKNMIGFTSSKFSANPTEGNVLPHSTRRYAITWGDNTGPYLYPNEEGDNFIVKFMNGVKREWYNFALGYYKAKLAINYGTTRLSDSASFGVWVFPWHLVLITLIILTIIYFLGKREIHKYNDWIISKAMGHIKTAHETIKRTINNSKRPKI